MDTLTTIAGFVQDVAASGVTTVCVDVTWAAIVLAFSSWIFGNTIKLYYDLR